MMQIKKFFQNWDAMRYFRLIAGIIVSITAIIQKDWVVGALGVFFLYQSAFNVGCGCKTSCAVPSKTIDSKVENPENTI
jgi:hypothetical protein